jgi:hypothetical protein
MDQHPGTTYGKHNGLAALLAPRDDAEHGVINYLTVTMARQYPTLVAMLPVRSARPAPKATTMASARVPSTAGAPWVTSGAFPDALLDADTDE